MKGRGSTARGKAQESGLSPDGARTLLSRLQTGQLVGEDDFLSVTGAPLGQACPAIYDKTCNLRKDNPNCVCGFIPAPESHRRKGLWQKEPEAVMQLGPDPSTSQREVPDSTYWLSTLHTIPLVAQHA